MIPYITYREPYEGGRLCFYILQKAFPHYCGILTTSPIDGALANAPIAGYRLWISFHGTILGNMIPSYNDVVDEINNVLFDMAQWYALNRLKDNKKYDKFKV